MSDRECPKCSGQLEHNQEGYTCLQCSFTDSGLPLAKEGRFYSEEGVLRFQTLVKRVGLARARAWVGLPYVTAQNLLLPAALEGARRRRRQKAKESMGTDNAAQHRVPVKVKGNGAGPSRVEVHLHVHLVLPNGMEPE